MSVVRKVKQRISKWQEAGLPLIFLRDCKTKKPSITFSMLVTSFIMCVLALIGKITEIVDGIIFNNALNLFIACSSIYFGRKFQKDGDKTILEESKEKDNG